jgi:S-adenosylmethionine hydrolase
VILGICPDATLVDISHAIPPQDVLAGALELEAVVPYLPPHTIVVGVVDPGVGSARRAVAIEAGALHLVGPDNGLFTLASRRLGPARAVELTNRRYMREAISHTFEGRDRFAPAAAWLATGVALDEFGPAVDDLVALDLPLPTRTPAGIEGIVVRIDRFGNLITNIDAISLARLADPLCVDIGGTRIHTVSRTYADAAANTLCALVGSSERLEVAVNGGSAFGVLRVGRGTPVRVRSVASGA